MKVVCCCFYYYQLTTLWKTGLREDDYPLESLRFKLHKGPFSLPHKELQWLKQPLSWRSSVKASVGMFPDKCRLRSDAGRCWPWCTLTLTSHLTPALRSSCSTGSENISLNNSMTKKVFMHLCCAAEVSRNSELADWTCCSRTSLVIKILLNKSIMIDVHRSIDWTYIEIINQIFLYSSTDWRSWLLME